MLSEGINKVTVGATYAWDGFEKGPTAEKRKELEEHLNLVWEGSFETEEQLMAYAQPETVSLLLDLMNLDILGFLAVWVQEPFNGTLPS